MIEGPKKKYTPGRWLKRGLQITRILEPGEPLTVFPGVLIIFSAILCVSAVSVFERLIHHRDAEIAETTQKRR